MKVLVTGAGAVLGQGIMRSLFEGSLGATVFAADPSPLAAGLYWVPRERRFLVPFANQPSFAPRVAAILAEVKPDAIIPGTDVELHVFAAHREDWEKRFGVRVIVSSPEVVGIADDKYLTFAFLKERGFAVPDSCLAGDEDALVSRVGFPLIVKPRVGARSVGVVRVDDRAALVRAIAEGNNVVIQECVATGDDEYTAGALVFDGVCEASIVMRRDLRDGNTHRAYVKPYPELDVQLRKMAEALRPHGPANFQFRVDGSGHAKVFEINARFSGTTPFRMRAGFNEVEMVLRRIVSGERVAQPKIQPMTILRYFTETVVPDGELAS